MPALTACKRALCPEASEPGQAQIKPETGGPHAGAPAAKLPSARGGTPASTTGRAAMTGTGASVGRARAESGPVKKAAKRTAPPPPSSTTPVPCPRCGSEATKFCYYNNYDPQQPRYYCKDCQRYWTVGGVLRNVPPGSGRRKSRSAASREHRKASASNLASSTVETAPTSEAAPSTAAMPGDLMQSNPLASMLISNLGLGASSMPLSTQAGRFPGDTASTVFSSQTTATTQCLPVAPSLLGAGAGVAPMLVTPSLLARLQAGPDGQGASLLPQQPTLAPPRPQQQGAAPVAVSAPAPTAPLSSMPSASAFTQHTRSSDDPSRSTESQAGMHPTASAAAQAVSSEQDTRSPECAQTGGNTSSGTPSATADTVTPALPPALQAPAPALNAATLPLLNGAQLLPPGNGAPQLPAGLLGYPAQQQSQQALQVQNQLLANMAVLPASAQVLLAQNAAWLAVQASTQGGVPDLSSQQASFTPTSFGTSFASSASIAPNGQGARSGSSGSQGSGANGSKSVANGSTSGGTAAPSSYPTSAFVPPILPLCTAAPSAPTAPSQLQWPLPLSSSFVPKPSTTPAPALWTSWLPSQNATAPAGPRPTFSSLPTPHAAPAVAPDGALTAGGCDVARGGQAAPTS